MTRRLVSIACVILALLAACDKAPAGIIDESDMVDLLVDLYKADAYRQTHPSQFPDDSTLMALKQSVMAGHGVTPADFDTSLVWYAHNMDAYTDVHRRVIDRLEHERSRIDPNEKPRPATGTEVAAARQQYYPASGDTADLWRAPRTWMLTPAMQSGYIPFDITPDRQARRGDSYELRLRAVNGQRSLAVLIAADYADGGTAYVTRNAVVAGANRISLPTDSQRTAVRVYGYLRYNVAQRQTVFIDSVQLLRTHLDPAGRPTSRPVRVIERDPDRKSAGGDRSPSVDANRPAPQVDVQPAAGRPTFKPRPGLNKSSHPRHINQSPNARHLPHTQPASSR